MYNNLKVSKVINLLMKKKNFSNRRLWIYWIFTNRRLLSSENFEILNLDKLSYSANILNIPNTDNNYSFCKIDICNGDEIKNILKDFAPDQIFHLAAESHVDNSIESPEDFIQSNIFGTYSMLEASRTYFKMLSRTCKENFRFVHVSTDEVFGDLKDDAKELFHEEFPYKPSSPLLRIKSLFRSSC